MPKGLTFADALGVAICFSLFLVMLSLVAVAMPLRKALGWR